MTKIYSPGPNYGTRLGFKFFRGSDDFIMLKFIFCVLMPVFLGLIMKAAYFLSFLLDACIALRVVGAVLVVFLRRWRNICTILQLMGSKGRYLTNKKQGNLD